MSVPRTHTLHSLYEFHKLFEQVEGSAQSFPSCPAHQVEQVECLSMNIGCLDSFEKQKARCRLYKASVMYERDGYLGHTLAHGDSSTSRPMFPSSKDEIAQSRHILTEVSLVQDKTSLNDLLGLLLEAFLIFFCWAHFRPDGLLHSLHRRPIAVVTRTYALPSCRPRY